MFCGANHNIITWATQIFQITEIAKKSILIFLTTSSSNILQYVEPEIVEMISGKGV